MGVLKTSRVKEQAYFEKNICSPVYRLQSALQVAHPQTDSSSTIPGRNAWNLEMLFFGRRLENRALEEI